MEPQGIEVAEEGGEPQAFQNPRFTKEIAAISFTVTSFQISRVKRREAGRSPHMPQESEA
jgi:hypothetical protein